MKVPFKNHPSVKGGHFNATQATDNEPNETYITKSSNASHQLKFDKKISSGILGMPSTETNFVEAPGPISESNNTTTVSPTPTILKDAPTNHEQKAASLDIPSIITSASMKGIADFPPKGGGPHLEPSQGHSVETRPSVSPAMASGSMVVLSVTNATRPNKTHAHAAITLPNTHSRLPTLAQQPTHAAMPVQAHTTNAPVVVPVESPAQNFSAVTPVSSPISNAPVTQTIQPHTLIVPAVSLVQPPAPNAIVALPVKSPTLNASAVVPVQTPTIKVPAVVSVHSPTPNESVFMPAESPTANATTAISALSSPPNAPLVVQVHSPTPNVALPVQPPSSLVPVLMSTEHLTPSAPAVLPVKSPTPNTTVDLRVESPTLKVAAVTPAPPPTPIVPAVGQGQPPTPDVPAVQPVLSPIHNVLVVKPAKYPTTNTPTAIPVQPSTPLATVVTPLQQPVSSASAAQTLESPTPMAPVAMQAEPPAVNRPAVVPAQALTLSTPAIKPALSPVQNASVVVPVKYPTLNGTAVAPVIPSFLFLPVVKPVRSPTADGPTVAPAKSSMPITPPVIPIKSPSSNAPEFMTFQVPTPSKNEVTPVHLTAPKEELLNAAPKPVIGTNEPLYNHLATTRVHSERNEAMSKIPQDAAIAQTGGMKVTNSMQTAGVSTSGILSAQNFASIVAGLRNAATKWYSRSTGKSATHQETSPQRVSVSRPDKKHGTDNRFLLQGEDNTSVTTSNETKSATEDTTKPAVAELLPLSTKPPNNFIKNATISASHIIVPSYSIIVAPFVIVVSFYLKI
ncbi:uncharacterized protein LOC142804133 isoform X2 [Rhipicephalus microplus]